MDTESIYECFGRIEYVANLQEAAEAVGKAFDPETRTEEEIQQLYELWVRWNGYDLWVFVREFL